MMMKDGAPGTRSHPPIASAIPSSSLHEIFRAADARARTSGTDVIKLHVGEPYFGPPAEVAEAVADAVRAGRTGYTDVQGLPELRRALADKLELENGLDTPKGRIFVTPGSCQGISALLFSLAEPGMEILLPELHWPLHVQQALLAGLRPVFYPLGPDPQVIRAAASPHTRILLVNSPANPTGAVLSGQQLRNLLEVAHERGWQVISDEAYEHFVYEGAHVSMASMEKNLPVTERKVHSVYSFSKSMAMTGYRLGYVVSANDAAAGALRVVQEASIIGPSTPVQYGGIAALQMQSTCELHHKMVRQNRDSVLPRLRAAGLLSELPAGGWYAMLDISRTGLSAESFASRLLEEKNVAVVPGTGFALRPRLDDAGALTSVDSAPWAKRLVRIAFCVDPAVLESGTEALLEFIQDCDNR